MRALTKNISLDRFFSNAEKARTRALMLDYDGTLAPFRIERDRALPYPGVRVTLDAILESGGSRLIIMTGRKIRELIPIIELQGKPEIWGSHGWERLYPDDRYEVSNPGDDVLDRLAEAFSWASARGFERFCEKKPACLALHWRGLEKNLRMRIESETRRGWGAIAHRGELALCDFDGGLELRSLERNKGHAVTRILSETDDTAAVAYLGDDLTDEDAFRALGSRGLSILVREELRETAADMWLIPPAELLDFLGRWSRICRSNR